MRIISSPSSGSHSSFSLKTIANGWNVSSNFSNASAGFECSRGYRFDK